MSNPHSCPPYTLVPTERPEDEDRLVKIFVTEVNPNTKDFSIVFAKKDYSAFFLKTIKGPWGNDSSWQAIQYKSSSPA
jgi:hypothetical protein